MEKAEEHDSISSKYGMWLFLFTEILFFGGLFIVYSVYRSNFAADFHSAAEEENLFLGSVNTLILLTSSLLIAMSLSAAKEGNNRLSAFLQMSTVLFGAVFLVIKYFEWMEKISAGIYPGSGTLVQMSKGTNLFFGLYFVMTGVHGLHVLIGMLVICFMSYYTLTGGISPGNFSRLENTGLYWHFVDIVWIYLFPLFYLVT